MAALFYSLIESAKLCRVQPKAYLRAAAEAAIGSEPPLLAHEFKAGRGRGPGTGGEANAGTNSSALGEGLSKS